MAIYHLHVKIIQRSKGRNIVSAAAYRRAARLWDEKEQRHWNYGHKSDVVHSEITVPNGAHDWVNALVVLHDADPSKAAEALWNKADAAEKRVDSQLARELEFALPLELNQDQNIILTRSFIEDQCAKRSMIADWNIHWDAGNPHVHVLLTMRELLVDGFGKRVLAWNSKLLINAWRSEWAEAANRHLSLHQHAARIDHRSYEAQGIDLVPTLHQGKAVTDMEARGIPTQIMHETQVINQENLSRIAADPSVILNKLAAHNETFTEAQLGQEFGRYVNDRGRFTLQEQKVFAENLLNDADSLDTLTQSQTFLTPQLIAHILKSIEAHDSVFKQRDLAKAIAPFTAHAQEFAHALLQIKGSAELLSLGVGEDGQERFTTKRMFALENNLQRLADRMRDRQHVVISDNHIQETIEQQEKRNDLRLTTEQVEAVHSITQPSALRCLIGRAGTGKSFSLRMAKVIWETEGLRVHGVTLSGIATEALHQETGILSSTIESFRYRLSEGHLVLNPHDVIVLDEAGMTDSVLMLFLLQAAQQAKAKLVLVGDPAQLQPIGPGASFRALLERIGFAELQTVYRQSEPWQREATVAFSKGDIAEGLSAYAVQQCLHFEPSAQAAMQTLVQDWLILHKATPHDLQHAIIIAHRNVDVTRLNQWVRAERVARGDMAEGYLTHSKGGDIHLAQGDRLVFLKNDRSLGVSNGRFATVQEVTFMESGRTRHFTVRLDGSEKVVGIDPQNYSDFTYGYAATVHKVQGMTVNRTFVYAEGFFWNRHLTYVAMSRHRDSCQVYINQATHRDQASLCKQLSRLGMKDSVLDFPLAFAERRAIDSSSVLQNFSKHLAKRLATWHKNIKEQFEQWRGLERNEEAVKESQRNESIPQEKGSIILDVESIVSTEPLSQNPPITSLQDILLRYVKMELEQTCMVHVLYAERAISFEAGAKASTQALAHKQAMQLFVKEVAARPDIIAVLEQMKKGQHISLAERGGSKDIHARMQKGGWLKEDMYAVLVQLRGQTRNQSRSRSKGRSRGGRSW